MTVDEALSIVRDFVSKVAGPDKTGPIIVGIDPGSEGAISFVGSNRYCVVDIPVFVVELARKTKKGNKAHKTVFDNPAIVAIFRELKPVFERVRVCLEEAQVMLKGRGANALTAFRVGVGFGMWGLFLAQKGYPLLEVHPLTWKTKMQLVKKDKEAARKMAISLFPKAPLQRKSDHNRAEALLLAHYAKAYWINDV